MVYKFSSLAKFLFADKPCINYRKPLFTKLFNSYPTFNFTRKYFYHNLFNRKCINLLAFEGVSPKIRRNIKDTKIRPNKSRIIGVQSFSGVIIVLISIFISRLKKNDITKRKQFILDEKEIMNNDEYNQIKKISKFEILDPSHSSYKLVLKVLNNIVEKNNLRNVYSVTIEEDDSVNSGISINGHIYINSGLLRNLCTKDQLTFDLSHEMAHYVLYHHVKAAIILVFKFIIFCYSLLEIFKSFSLITRFGLTFILWSTIDLAICLPLTRRKELEADKVGFFFAAKAGADIRNASLQFVKWALEQENPYPEWLSTHPSHETRISQLEKLIEQELEAMQRNQCPLILGPDPRKESDLALLQKKISTKKFEWENIPCIMNDIVDHYLSPIYIAEEILEDFLNILKSQIRKITKKWSLWTSLPKNKF